MWQILMKKLLRERDNLTYFSLECPRFALDTKCHLQLLSNELGDILSVSWRERHHLRS